MYLRTGMVLILLATFALAGDLNVIVGFKGDVDDGVVKKHGARCGPRIDGIGAMAATIPAAKLGALRAEPSVAYVEEDGYVSISKPSSRKPGGGDTSTAPPPEERPWGINRVGGAPATNTGAGIKVAVIDTGLDLDHADLAGNIKGKVDFTGSRAGADDENGHGSHVGGTIAAIDNDIGVIGVAPQAHLYAVRCLDRRGWGTWSAVAAALQWAGDNGMQIANMSLGGGSNSTLQSACSYAEGKGVLLIAAAGNEGDGSTATTELSYPAAYSTVVAVAATNSSDGLASFSNSGSHVGVAAPGVSVRSTYKGNGYATMNGTSMASPHAAGVAALIWSASGSTDKDAVRAELQRRVDDAGAPGKDNGYGYGIVDFSNG